MNVYTVSQANGYIKNLIDSDYVLRSITIKGEISNCKYHSMGHIYFAIKDEGGSMRCVMFRSNVASGLKFRLEDGQAVVITGNVSVYERDGSYQLYARKIVKEDDGKGKLYEEFEKLKQKLYDEGLFDFETKKPIPAFPKSVGIVTSKTGAAIQDIMNIAKRRNPYVQLVLYPAQVQGEGAAATIARGIRYLDTLGLDTIIVGRGGGSIEDLWAFNEEIVARAIYEANTPIISGTGHEVDNTIADYVADLRAPTPSAAAELAIPDIMSTINKVDNLKVSIDRGIVAKLRSLHIQLERCNAVLNKLSPEMKLFNNQQRLSDLKDSMDHIMDNKFQNLKHRLAIDMERLNGLSPTAKLINGFGYLSSEDKPVNSVNDVKINDTLEVTIHDGTIVSQVIEISK